MSHPIVEETLLKCDKGTVETPMKVTSQNGISICSKLQATEEDKQAQSNIVPFGQCKLKPIPGGFLPCTPSLIQWLQTSPFTINGKKELTTDSYCMCSTGGKITPNMPPQGTFETIKEDDSYILSPIFTDESSDNNTDKIKPGYYYKENGSFIGHHAGENDNTVFVVKFALKNNFNNIININKVINLTEKYSITHSQLLDRANWIYAEGGYKISEYYAYSIENAYQSKLIANKREDMLYYWLLQDSSGRLDKDKYLSGLHTNQTGKRFWERREKPSTFDNDMKNTIASVIKSKMYPEKDPTGGTNAWLGYKSGKHKGEYFILSLGRRHFFQIYGQSKLTDVEKQYIIIP